MIVKLITLMKYDEQTQYKEYKPTKLLPILVEHTNKLHCYKLCCACFKLKPRHGKPIFSGRKINAASGLGAYRRAYKVELARLYCVRRYDA